MPVGGHGVPLVEGTPRTTLVESRWSVDDGVTSWRHSVGYVKPGHVGWPMMATD